MSQVYEDAQFTIAAASAAGDDYGFLGTDPLKRLHHCSEDLYLDLRGETIYGLRFRIPHDLRDLMSVDPLNTRGWTLQERLLSRRLLTFGSTAVMYECPQTAWCECGSGFYPNSFSRKDETIQLELADKDLYYQRLLPTLGNEQAEDRLFEYWRVSIVTRFSQRRLTRRSDVLPALSGIAKKFSTVTHGAYLAGIWQPDLLKALTWEVTDDFKGDLTLKDMNYLSAYITLWSYNAPSWSWASTGAPVTHWIDKDPLGRRTTTSHKSFARVIDADVKLSGSDGFGEILDGYLRIKGPCIPARLCIDEVNSGQSQWTVSKRIILSNGKFELMATPATPVLRLDAAVKEIDSYEPSGLIREAPEWSTTLGRSNETGFGTAKAIDGWVILLLLWQSNTPVTGIKSRWFLILGGDSERKGSYRRIGFLRILHAEPEPIQAVEFLFSSFDEREVTIH
jgi:hypothetical protein